MVFEALDNFTSMGFFYNYYIAIALCDWKALQSMFFPCDWIIYYFLKHALNLPGFMY